MRGWHAGIREACRLDEERIANIQWFPGHMARARRVLSENMRLVDVVVELVDARIPYSSRNPEIDRILSQKPRVMVANKKDLADSAVSGYWKGYYKNSGIPVLFTDCQRGSGVKEVTALLKTVMAEKTKRYEEKGRKTPVIRTMAVGIPNVGKSSFINRVAGKAAAVTGDKPGVTRNKQWLRMKDDIYLLDTPGLLWPKFEDQRCAYKLACTGAIKDDVLDVTDIACFLLVFLLDYYPEALAGRYRIACTEYERGAQECEDDSTFLLRKAETGAALLTACGRQRGCFMKGGAVDLYRAAGIVLDDFRAGKLGRISLDRAETVSRCGKGERTAGENDG